MKIEIKSTYIVDGVAFNERSNAKFFLKYINKKNKNRVDTGKTEMTGDWVMSGLKELLRHPLTAPNDSIIEMVRNLQVK